MKVDINKLKENIPLDLEEDLSPQELDLESRDIHYQGPLRLKFRVTKQVSIVEVKSCAQFNWELICSRCGRKFCRDFKRNFKFNYPIKKAQPIIDISDDVRQSIILDYPIKILCSPDCKGLCPQCGKDLNQGRCSCSKG